MNKNYFSQQKRLVQEFEESLAKRQRVATLVEIQKDYARDDQLCLTSLVFPPAHITEKIFSEVIQPLRQIEPQHYFYPVGSLHLTIKNIRTIHKPPLFTERDVLTVQKLFREIIPKFSSFDFQVEDVLLLPTSVSIQAYSSDVLQKLVLALDEGLRNIGVPDNKKYISNTVFWGNITVCRFVSQPQDAFLRAVHDMRNAKIGSFSVEQVHLVTCNSVCHPDSRTILGTYALAI